MACLLNIPLEVLLQITSYLTTPEYGCLRRTCKQLEASLFGAFAKEFFSKRQFALLQFSIQALVDISKSRLGPSLTHLIIHLEYPHASSDGPVGPMGSMPIDDLSNSVRHNRSYVECISHYEFITTGLDVEMLTDAIKRLPNLETIGIRDFHSKNRHRDGTAWHGYGCPTLLKETLRPLSVPNSLSLTGFNGRHRGPEYTNHVFLTVLRAVGNAAVSGYGSKLTRIEVLLHKCNLRDQSFRIPDHLSAGILLALSKLTTILLDGLGHARPCPYVATVGNQGDVFGTNFFLSRFLTEMPAIEHLRLNFQYFRPHEPEKFLEWLAETKGVTNNATTTPLHSLALATASGSLPLPYPPTPKFSNLRCLEIGMITVTENVLIALINKYKPTLRTVSFHKTTLASQTDGKVNLWARLCNTMAKADLGLTMLQLSYMRQMLSGRSTYCAEVTIRGSKDRNVKVWRGTAFSHAIKDITAAMEVSWEDDRSEDDDDSSLNDDDDESMQDDDDD
ncbi:hypothetical protein F4861DRAFT_141034 [Xylaria intraflava]|nr:hypothetical protein F4861DRAFT_141034 [Xylaria intraflava]